tara:strand:+ start:67 stop:471 length:405 start_codon:yes stop_codon:yes gene_type:complete
MCYSLEQIFQQAKEDSYTASLDSDGCEAKILYGVRIERIKSIGTISIHNTTKGGDYYTKIEPEELLYFLQKGWRYGVFSLALSNYRSKLDIIEHKIREEVNTRKNAKHIQSLKSNRQRILNRFAKVSHKLNQIK